eukprot:309626_1
MWNNNNNNAPFNPYPFTSPQLNSSVPFDNLSFQPLQRSQSAIQQNATQQNALIPIMIKLQNEMSQLLNLIEIEKRNIPPNISLIQFYNNLHGQKIQLFKRHIPWLPVNTPNNIIHQHQNTNHHDLVIQGLTFQDYWKQNQQQHSQLAVNIHGTNNNNTNDNSSPRSISSNHNSDINSSFIKSQSTALQTLSNTISTPSYDLDALKRSYSKTPSISSSISKQSKQSWRSRLPETPTPSYSKTSLHPMSRSISKQSKQSSIGGYTSSRQSSLPETPIPDDMMTMNLSITPTPNNIKAYPVADDEPFAILKYENECKSIEQCQCIQNIIRVLLFYQKYQNQQTNKYTNTSLLNDYHHILKTHLDYDTQNNNKQFELINQEFSKYIYCDVNNCQQYQRKQRNREKK